MNEYLIPICNIKDDDIYIETIHAASMNEAENKLMYRLMDRYDYLPDADRYDEFVDICSEDYDLLIGSIKELDELC